MKKLLIFLFTIISFSIVGCGTIGGFEIINFDCNKKKMTKEIDTFYSKNPEFVIPEKWKKFDDWGERGYNFLDGRIFYFPKSPEEMYYVTFIGDSATQNSSSYANMSIRAISSGNAKWLLNKDLSKNEIRRISDRFKNEVLAKINCLSNP